MLVLLFIHFPYLFICSVQLLVFGYSENRGKGRERKEKRLKGLVNVEKLKGVELAGGSELNLAEFR